MLRQPTVRVSTHGPWRCSARHRLAVLLLALLVGSVVRVVAPLRGPSRTRRPSRGPNRTGGTVCAACMTEPTVQCPKRYTALHRRRRQPDLGHHGRHRHPIHRTRRTDLSLTTSGATGSLTLTNQHGDVVTTVDLATQATTATSISGWNSQPRRTPRYQERALSVGRGFYAKLRAISRAAAPARPRVSTILKPKKKHKSEWCDYNTNGKLSVRRRSIGNTTGNKARDTPASVGMVDMFRSGSSTKVK
ncbi:hypothetical protein EV648_12636 [Kribbella sp. VKM Ac-2568]|nr:hypothetical protein EV648_12636 [Kribbella sp. VKM Ac-2568]